jgi:hypothetical protein
MPTGSAHHHKVEHTRIKAEDQSGPTRVASRRRRVVQIALVATICAMATVSCGSSDPGKSGDGPTGQGKFAGALAFARCMRSHGVPGFPDPKVTGNSIQVLGYSSGLDSQSPAFSSAQQSCKQLLPGDGSPSQDQIAQARAELLAVSHCMRAHSISPFPDPTTSRPSNRADYDMIIGHDGAFLAIPDSIALTSPAFKQAAAACNLGLPTDKPKAPST